MMKLRSPIPWFGGKANMVPKILPFFPTHRIYVEPFGGGASLLMAKEPSPVEVYNDLDDGLVALFRVIRDPDKFSRFYHLVIHTPYSRAEWAACNGSWQNCIDEVEKAFRFFVTIRQSFAGLQRCWGRVVLSSSRGMAATTSSWLSIFDLLSIIHRRLIQVQIEKKDYMKILNDYDSPDTFFYLDPPYVPATRKEGEYAHELTIEDHEQLIDRLLKLQGKAILSGYAHPVHTPLEKAGWERRDFDMICSVVGRTKDTRGISKARLRRVETIWISPNCRQD